MYDGTQTARSTVLVDNERVRVTEWVFAPGQATGHHRHEMDYVVVPVTSGRMRISSPAGEQRGDLVAGSPYFRSAGVEHNVVNDSDSRVVFIEVEVR